MLALIRAVFDPVRVHRPLFFSILPLRVGRVSERVPRFHRCVDRLAGVALLPSARRCIC